MNEAAIRSAAIAATKAAITHDIITNPTIQVKCENWFIEFLLELVRKAESGENNEP